MYICTHVYIYVHVNIYVNRNIMYLQFQYILIDVSFISLVALLEALCA